MSLRFIAASPLAMVVVAGLFLLMQSVIAVGDVILEERRDVPTITITPQIAEPEPLKPVKPQSLTPPKLPQSIASVSLDPPMVDSGAMGSLDFSTADPVGTLPSLDRDAQPLVRVNPEGFERCFGAGTDGVQRVRLRFDVDPLGNVANAAVIGSTDRCFERSARRAVERWKYNPKISGGEGVWRRGVETTIIFELAE